MEILIGRDANCGRDTKCELCLQDVSGKDIKQHLDCDCPEKVVLCPNKCGGCFKRKDINSHTNECKLEALLQELKQQLIRQETKITEQQQIIVKLEKELQEQKEALTRLQGGGEGGEHFIDKVMRVIHREMTEERITWCWGGLLVALPIITIAIYETCDRVSQYFWIHATGMAMYGNNIA